MKRTGLFTVAIMAIFALLSVTADAATSITVANHSFESDTLSDGSSTTTPASWTTAGSAGAINLNSSQINEGSVDGSNSGWVDPSGSLSQTLSDTFIAGKVYTLSVLVARRIDHTAPQWTLALAEGSGGSTLASVSNLIPDGAPEDGSFTNQVLMYTAQPADSGKEIKIVLSCSTSSQAQYDNVRLSYEDAPTGSTVTIDNSSFEDPDVADGGWSTTVANWDQELSGVVGVVDIPDGESLTGLLGENVLFINGAGTVRAFQKTGRNFVEGQECTLTVGVARRSGNTIGDPSGWKIELAAGGGGTTQSVAELSGAISNSDPEHGAVTDKTLNYTATAADAGKEIIVRLSNPNIQQVVFENVRLSASSSPVKIIDGSNNGALRGVPGTVHGGGLGSFISDFDGSSSGGFNSGHRYSTGVHAGRPAIWSFHALPENAYAVYATWIEAASRTTAAPFKIYDGADTNGTLLASGTLDQEQAPNDLTVDDGWGSFAWDLLGEVGTDTGMITVLLESVANSSGNDYVIADAIRLEPLPKGTMILIR